MRCVDAQQTGLHRVRPIQVCGHLKSERSMYDKMADSSKSVS
jgi:hypothetical protein